MIQQSMQQTWVWHKPTWRRLPLTPSQNYQNLHRTGETDSWRTQTKPCAHQDPGERSSDHKRLTQTCLWASRSLWQRHGSAVACCRVGSTQCSNVCMGPFKVDYLHYLHHSLASGQITRNRTETSTENWIKDLLSMAPPTRTRLLSGSFHKLLILIPQRVERMKTTTTEN